MRIASVYLDPKSFSQLVCAKKLPWREFLWREKFIHDFGEDEYKMARFLRYGVSDKELYFRHSIGAYMYLNFFPMFAELHLVDELKQGDLVPKNRAPLNSRLNGVVTSIFRSGDWAQVRLKVAYDYPRVTSVTSNDETKSGNYADELHSIRASFLKSFNVPARVLIKG